MNMQIPDELNRPIRSLQGLECWEASCGGAAGSTFQLALGEKVPLPVPSKETKHSGTFPQWEGQASILVWCAWRLDSLEGPLTSWDDTEQSIKAGLTRLVGARIDSLEILPPAWDMNIKFSNALFLRIFCDHVPGEPSFDGNWDLRIENVTIAIGPGVKYRVEDRMSAKRG
jgi:hypothetical protein